MTRGWLVSELTISAIVMMASGEPLELVLMPLLMLRIKLPLLRLASKILDSL